MLRKPWALALLLLPLSAYAEGVSYNYFEANYIIDEELDVDIPGFGSGSDDGDGFAVAGSFAFNETFFGNASYSDASLDDSGLDLSNLSIGVGARSAQWTGAVDLFGVLSYEDTEVDSLDDSGFGIAGGLRGLLADNFELNGQVKYTDIGDADGVGFKVGGVYAFNPNWGVTGDWSTSNLEDDTGAEVDIDELRVGVRYIF